VFYCNPEYKDLFDQYGINSVETLYRFCDEGQLLYEGSISTVWRHRMGDCGIYAKRYRYSTPRWEYLFRKSRGENELWSYECFRQFGIPCPEVLAFAEVRKWGRFYHCVIVTKEIPHAPDLSVLFRDNRLESSLRIRIMEKLGHYVALLHGEKFYYHDLKLRNILWKEDSGKNEGLYFIDCPRGRKMPWHSYRAALYDLKTLYKHAHQVCSPTEWQSFLTAYAAHGRFSETNLMTDITKDHFCTGYRGETKKEDFWKRKN
jgi:tRNA A-37 threonylcarbamoyl transferase component Bud32